MSALDGIRQRATITERSVVGALRFARTDVPRLLAALDAVLGWHLRNADHCVHCKHEWPCPTVADVNDALEAGQ